MTLFLCLFFFFYCYAAHRDLHSFPTRRSSDLQGVRVEPVAAAVRFDEPLLDGHDRAEFGAQHLRVDQAEAHRSRSEEHTSELQSHSDLVCRLLLEKKKNKKKKEKNNTTSHSKL